MTKITNAIGKVTDIEYTTIAIEMARDGGAGAWRYRIPSPMNIVKRLNRTDTLTNLQEVTEYTYRDSFYDGAEKQFRGFERVLTALQGDETIEAGLTEEIYDVGATDTYRNGLLLSTTMSSGGRDLSSTHNTYEDCPVAELEDGLRFDVRHLCQTATLSTSKEGLSEAEWHEALTETTYDGYGNVTLEANHGITSIGGGSCTPCDGRDADEFGAPCGPSCLGDEMFTQTEYVSTDNTNGRWITGAPFRVITFGREGSSLATEALTYYDGDAFEGLSLGQLDQGNVTRVTNRYGAGSTDIIETTRNKYDSHGNVIETLDPLGEEDGTTHRRVFEYDLENLRVVRADILLEDVDGNPYALRRELAYEPLFDKVFEATEWLRVEGDNVVSIFRGYSYEYDEFGRMTVQFMPGNTGTEPDEAYEYDLQEPVSRIITHKRSEVGRPFDMKGIQCFDGRGRSVQTRTQIESGLYQVTEYQRFNIRSQPVEIFQPYTSDSEECDRTAPEGVVSKRIKYDATYREIESTLGDADIYGTASKIVTVYEPYTTITFDEEDSDPNSPHSDTPTTTFFNGLDLPIAIERTLTGEAPARTTVHYDSLGRMIGYTDDQGNRKEQFFDLLGRVTRLVDPNSAQDTRFEHDDASNVIRQIDDRGVVTINVFDGSNRRVATYDEADEQGTRIDLILDIDPNCPECINAEGMPATVTFPGPDGEVTQDKMAYDLRSRLTTKTRTTGGVDFEFNMAYDNANRPTSTTNADGTVVELVYDAASRLIEIPGLIHTITYSERNLIDGMGCADGTSSTLVYDAIGRMTQATIGGTAGLIQGMDYTFDRMGNILSIEDLAADAPGVPSFAAEHAYDAWYRTLSSRYDKEGDADETITLDFNSIDNLTAITSSLGAASPAHVGDLSYDSFAPNAVTEAGDVLFDYDANGNVDERGAQTYTWDFMNRLTQVDEDGGAIAHFFYGQDQSRVAKRETDSTTLYLTPSFEVRDGIATTYVKLGSKRAVRIESDALATTVFEDRDEDGLISASDALLAHADGDESGPVLWSGVRRLLMETGPDDGVTFLHHDHLGSITLATGQVDGEQVVLGHRNFSPLGTERTDGFGYVDEYGFTGQEIDRSTGLIHFDWRYYDPTIGRWLSIDPKFGTSTKDNLTAHGESTTAYAYVAGNVTNGVDPTGLCGWCKKLLGKGGKSKKKGEGKSKDTGTKSKLESGKVEGLKKERSILKAQLSIAREEYATVDTRMNIDIQMKGKVSKRDAITARSLEKAIITGDQKLEQLDLMISIEMDRLIEATKPHLNPGIRPSPSKGPSSVKLTEPKKKTGFSLRRRKPEPTVFKVDMELIDMIMEMEPLDP